MAATVLKIISSEPAPLPTRCSQEAGGVVWWSYSFQHGGATVFNKFLINLSQVNQIVQLCLQKDPSRRPSAKAGFLRALPVMPDVSLVCRSSSLILLSRALVKRLHGPKHSKGERVRTRVSRV